MNWPEAGFRDGPTIPEGVRNVTLTSHAGTLRARGASAEELLERLRETNRLHCDPPLPDGEVRAIAKSIGRKPAYPTRRKERRGYGSPEIPKGCFDPREAVCGFDVAAIVANDSTLGLKRRHKALFGLLRNFYGPFGCHPAQSTIAGMLFVCRQQVARDILGLVRAGLVQTQAGAYNQAEAKYPCTSYHFPKHELFRARSDAAFLPVSNELGDFAQHVQSFPQVDTQSSLKNERVTAERAHRCALVTNTEARSAGLGLGLDAGGTENQQRSREEKRAFAEQQKLKGAEGEHFLAWSVPAPGYYNRIVQYLECAAGCGGMRVVYSDGTIKRYECSCEMKMAEVA